MDYPFESLGPMQFQQLCQALVAKAYPHMQSFPLNQGDGGRDAVAVPGPREAPGFVVFQVKYLDHTMSPKTALSKLISAVKGELPKIRELISRGATAYCLITNVRGTGALDKGSIDKVLDLIRPLGVFVECWWRDTLISKLDGDWTLKMRFPAILSGPDFLRYVMEQGLSEHRERRRLALEAFMHGQFHRDQEVRFSQIDLKNTLLDLFIDVPATMRVCDDDHERSTSGVTRLLLKYDGERIDRPVGAAALLLDPQAAKILPHIVLEGAPGQGKSTLCQFVCQVYRMLALGKTEQLKTLATHHQPSSLRVPIKCEFRQFATWLNGKNPFSPRDDVPIPAHLQWERSLESFLAALISHVAGGDAFSITDLRAVASVTPLLLVIDAFDEVAGDQQRQELVDLVSEGVAKLNHIAKSLQVVITSRPPAFSSSPGFNRSIFPHLSLDSVTQPLIDLYSRKWIEAKRLDAAEGEIILSILKDKLQLPHIREIAKNPMQLAILLSLISKKGQSLPNRRTEVYRHYVELFFDREVEKKTISRDRRNLLHRIHGCLAWHLHSEVEQENPRGQLSYDRLVAVVEDFLASLGHPKGLAREFFIEAMERVVFIVSREQGAFEFEVQPLREYFAAEHLYRTVKHSSYGQSGTIQDRVDAIYRSPFWLNVTRFFAGHVDIGHLPFLVHRLKALAKDEGYRLIGQPERLTAMFLADGVFEDYPDMVREAVQIVTEGIRQHRYLGGESEHRRISMLPPLPWDAGGREITHACLSVLERASQYDIQREMAEIIQVMCPPDEWSKLWWEGVRRPKSNIARWLSYLNLGLSVELSEGAIDELLGQRRDASTLSALYNLRHGDYLMSSPLHHRILLEGLLDGKVRMLRAHGSYVLSQFSAALNYRQFFSIVNYWDGVGSARQALRGMYHPYFAETNTSDPISDTIQACLPTVDALDQVLDQPLSTWKSSLTPWRKFSEIARSRWGYRRPIIGVAHLAAATVPCDDAQTLSLLDHDAPLCERFLYARTQGSNARWWQEQLDGMKTPTDKLLVILALASWADRTIVAHLAASICAEIDAFPLHDWAFLYECLELVARGEKRVRRLPMRRMPNSLSPRVSVLLGMNLGWRDLQSLYGRYLADYSELDPVILDFAAKFAMRTLMRNDKAQYAAALAVVRRAYCSGVSHASFYPYAEGQFDSETGMTILASPDLYPRSFMAPAIGSVKAHLMASGVKISEVAKHQRWFDRVDTTCPSY